MKEKIACIAGTPVDTEMGVVLLKENGYHALSFPSSKDPDEEMLFQISSKEHKHKKLFDMLTIIKNEGIEKVFVYCNSLSSAVDFKALSRDVKIKIVTPLDVYAEEAVKYKKLGVIAANSVATNKIEKVFINTNPEIELISIGMFPLVWSIEKKLSPKKVMDKHSLKKLCEWFYENEAEAILLGCTHFPYIYDELVEVSKIPIVEPSKRMLELLK